MPDDQELITRILEGSLEGAEAAAVAERIESDLRFRARVADQLLIARTVPLALSAPGQSAESTVGKVGALLHHLRPSRRVASIERIRQRLRQRHQRSWRAWIITGASLAAAAGLVVSWLVLVPTTPDVVLAQVVSGPQSGRLLRSGDEVQADGPMTLHMRGDDEARIEMLAGTTLRCDTQDGSPVLRLQAGGLACSVAPRGHQQPLLFVAGPWTYRVVGTRFTLQRSGDLSGLDVTEGTVAVGRTEADQVMVHGGQAHRADDRGRTELRSDADGQMVEDFDLVSGRLEWRSSGNEGTQVTRRWIDTGDRPGRSLEVSGEWRRVQKQVTYAQAHGQVRLGVLSQEMSSGVAVRVRSGSGGTLRICVLEGPDPARAETHTSDIADDQEGWREIVVPWTGFRHARQFQLPGAPNDGLDPIQIRVVVVQVLPPAGAPASGPVRFSIDDVRLLPPTRP